MSQDPISTWVEKAKLIDVDAPTSESVTVIRRPVPQNSGALIMEIAEKLKPHLVAMFDGVKDKNGVLMQQPARIRAIALNVAQMIVKNQKAS